MLKKEQKILYIKISSHGAGAIPLGAEGKILIYAKHPITTKLLVNFFAYGKAIVPLSSVQFIND